MIYSIANDNFIGDTFTWWGCCMPPGISSNAANVTYSIDGGDALSVPIDENFIQSAHCKDERILLQTQPGQIQPGNHTLEVIYGGDDTKMPLTLCALAATPLDVSVLDVLPSNSHPQFHSPPPASSPALPSPTNASPSPSIRHGNSMSSDDGNRHGSNDKSSSGSDTGVIVGVIVGIVFAFLSVFIVVYILRRKRARDVESRISFNAPRLAVRRVVSSVDLAVHDPDRKSVV